MNRLNPIYILALVITLFILSITTLNNKKDEFNSLNKEFNSMTLKAENYKNYKDNWFNEKKVVKKLESILKSSTFKNEKILKTEVNNIIRVKIESQNPRVLSKFLNRVLNEKFIFKKLNIQKRYISFEIGVK